MQDNVRVSVKYTQKKNPVMKAVAVTCALAITLTGVFAVKPAEPVFGAAFSGAAVSQALSDVSFNRDADTYYPFRSNPAAVAEANRYMAEGTEPYRSYYSKLMATMIMQNMIVPDYQVTIANEMKRLGYVKGVAKSDGTIDLELDKQPTLIDTIVLLARVTGVEDKIKNKTYDLRHMGFSAWQKPYIGWAIEEGILTGVHTGKITANEAMEIYPIMGVNLLTKSSSSLSVPEPISLGSDMKYKYGYIATGTDPKHEEVYLLFLEYLLKQLGYTDEDLSVDIVTFAKAVGLIPMVRNKSNNFVMGLGIDNRSGGVLSRGDLLVILNNFLKMKGKELVYPEDYIYSIQNIAVKQNFKGISYDPIFYYNTLQSIDGLIQGMGMSLDDSAADIVYALLDSDAYKEIGLDTSQYYGGSYSVNNYIYPMLMYKGFLNADDYTIQGGDYKTLNKYVVLFDLFPNGSMHPTSSALYFVDNGKAYAYSEGVFGEIPVEDVMSLREWNTKQSARKPYNVYWSFNSYERGQGFEIQKRPSPYTPKHAPSSFESTLGQPERVVNAWWEK
jgi:hypothetical protein